MDTTRASKNIQLILISSALAYGGWYVGQRLMADDQRRDDPQHRGHHYVHGPSFWHWGGGHWGGGLFGPSHSGSMGLAGGGSHSSSTGTHGSSGSASSRGGFGGSGHSAAS